jgi:rhodanese-related sulfurtransferase/DNA-binding transcriptional ArsR family regulator
MGHREFKQRLYPEFARIGQALASDRRLELLDLLAQAPRHVEALAHETDMSVANVSQHLQVLRAAHLVEADREGNRIVYCLAGPDVLRLWLALRGVAEHRLPEIARVTQRFAVPGAGGAPIERAALTRMLADGSALLIDVRPALEFAAGHIPGALSIPPDELPSRMGDLPRDRTIIAYCRGEYCLFADEAVALLRERGFDAHQMDGGWIEWAAEAGSGDAAGIAHEPGDPETGRTRPAALSKRGDGGRDS